MAPDCTHCYTCHVDIGTGRHIQALGHMYHPDCFQCTACHKPFGPESFSIKDGEPYHSECYKILFHPRCELCEQFIPVNPQTKRISFKVSPFWGTKYCPSHEGNRDRCSSCYRLEPLPVSRHFNVLSDGRKTCDDCSTNVILDSAETKEVVAEIWKFMASVGLRLPEIPLLLVDYDTLNEHCHGHHALNKNTTVTVTVDGEGHTTRGICVSEVSQIRHYEGQIGNAPPKLSRIEKKLSVSAILILHGLPYDLTGQVLAHEATHAFIKLHESFPEKIALHVEEGVCQLMSFLWLNYKQQITSKQQTTEESENESFERRLRDFYIQSIENDPSEIYGDGFRMALESYNRTRSLQRIFDSIRENGTFP